MRHIIMPTLVGLLTATVTGAVVYGIVEAVTRIGPAVIIVPLVLIAAFFLGLLMDALAGDMYRSLRDRYFPKKPKVPYKLKKGVV